MIAQATHFSSCACNSTRKVLRGRLRHAKRMHCTSPVAFAPRRVSRVIFHISLILEQTSKDCIGNTEHSNIKVNDECNSK